jgi:hypothetical protein
MCEQHRFLRFVVVVSGALATAGAVAGGCGSQRNLIGFEDGGAGVGGPTGTAGIGPLGIAGSAGGLSTAGSEGTSVAGASGSAGAAGVSGAAGASGAAGTIGAAGSSSTCQPGLYVPPQSGNAGSGAAGSGVDPTILAPPTSSTPLPVAPPVDYVVGPVPISMTAGDLDGDGKVDLVVGTFNSGVKVLLNKGEGAFSAPVSYAYSGDVAAGDVSGDGKLDLVVANQRDIWVLVNDGSGKFTAPIAPVNRTSGHYFASPAVGDFDKDGKADIVISDINADPPVVTVLLNQGAGKFATPVSSPVGSYIGRLVLQDMDGDGCPDVVGASFNAGAVSLMRNPCDGSANLGAPTSWRTGGAPSGIAVGALAGGAAFPDVVASLQSPADINVFVAASTPGDFNPAVRYDAGAGARAVALGDVDGDGDLDAVVSLTGGIGVLLNNGDRTFAPPLTALSPCGSQEQLDLGGMAVALADLDGDGHLDFAATSNVRGVVTVYLNRLK